MVWVDFLIVITIGLSLAFGVWRGFVKEALSLAAWVVGFWVALSHWSMLAQALEGAVGKGGFTAALAFGLLLFGVLIVGAAINHFVAQGIEKAGLKALDRLLGGAFGFVRGVGICAVLLLFAGLMHADRTDAWQRSKLVPYFKPVVGWLRGHLDDAPNFG